MPAAKKKPASKPKAKPVAMGKGRKRERRYG